MQQAGHQIWERCSSRHSGHSFQNCTIPPRLLVAPLAAAAALLAAPLTSPTTLDARFLTAIGNQKQQQ